MQREEEKSTRFIYHTGMSLPSHLIPGRPEPLHRVTSPLSLQLG